MIVFISPSELQPPNAVWNVAHFEKLALSMRERGWRGRPLLAVGSDKEKGVLKAVTGAHRQAAAVSAGLTKIPVYVSPVTSKEHMPEFGQPKGWFLYFAHHGDAIACAILTAEHPEDSQLT